MRHLPISLLLCLLLAATGFALVGVGTTLSLPDVAGSSRGDEEDVALVRTFYAAVDAVLTTGEPDPLDDLVAPDLIEHPAPPHSTAGRAGLVRSLLAQRAAFPQLRLVVDDVQASGNHLVTARIHATGFETGIFLGLGLSEMPASWGPIAVLRVADGRIAERWTGGEASLFEPLGQATITGRGSPPWSRQLTLARLTASPDSRLAIENGEASRIVLLERGALTAEILTHSSGTAVVSGRSDRPRPLLPGQSREFTIGDRFVTAPGAAFAVANNGALPAAGLLITIGPGGGDLPVDVFALAAAAERDWAATHGISTDIVAIAWHVPVPPGAVLGIGRIALAPRTPLALPAANGAIVVAIESGNVELATIGGDGRGHRADGRSWGGYRVTLGPGDDVSLSAGIGGLWRAGDGAPATLLVLVVTPPPPDSPWAEELIVVSRTPWPRTCRECP